MGIITFLTYSVIATGFLFLHKTLDMIFAKLVFIFSMETQIVQQ